MAAAKKVGDLIKEARTKAGLTQVALAAKVDGLSSTDIGKAERGEKDLTNDQLKLIAKATGVTQKSLLEAPKGSSAKKTSSTSSSTASSSSSSSAAKTSMKLTATEKKLVELYRSANSDTKKSVMNLLKGKEPDASDILTSLLGGAVDLLKK